MNGWILVLFAVGCAFLMGYAVNQGSTCAVTAAKQLVHERHGTIFSGFAVATGTSGLLCLPLAWVFGDGIHVARDAGLSLALIAGAAMTSVGAVVNDACLFGTLSRIGRGEVRFLALPLGLAIGFAIANRQDVLRAPETTANPLAMPSLAGAAAVIGFALLLIFAWRWLGRGETVRHREWPLRNAMVVLGICGALLFTLTPGWTYADAVRRSVAPGASMAMVGWGAWLAAVAALAGTVAAGIRARSFVLQSPTMLTLTRSLIGGTIMAIGATLIPGGNDTLLLSAVPAATLSGIAGYAIISALVPVILLIQRRIGVTMARGRAKDMP